jgi:hypothetical protein
VKDFLFDHHIVPAVIPIADAFAGGINTEAVSLANYRRATLIIQTGAIEDAGISNLLKLQACTAADGTGATDMAFTRRVLPYTTSVDTWGAKTDAAATGYNFAAGTPAANAVWMAEVTADELQAALDGALFVRANIAETANKTVTASGLWILSDPRYPQSVPVGAIA